MSKLARVTAAGIIGASLGGFLPPSHGAPYGPAYRHNPGATARRKKRKAGKLARRNNRSKR